MTDLRDGLARVLCAGVDDRVCINFDPDVDGGCPWCRRDADAVLASGVLDQIRAAAWGEGWADASDIACGCLGSGGDRNPYRSEASDG